MKLSLHFGFPSSLPWYRVLPSSTCAHFKVVVDGDKIRKVAVQSPGTVTGDHRLQDVPPTLGAALTGLASRAIRAQRPAPPSPWGQSDSRSRKVLKTAPLAGCVLTDIDSPQALAALRRAKSG